MADDDNDNKPTRLQQSVGRILSVVFLILAIVAGLMALFGN